MKNPNFPINTFKAFIITSFLFLTANLSHAALPTPWVNTEVGPAVSSSADFANNQFTLNAKGMDIAGISDVFDFVNQPFTGDVEIIAKIESFGTLTTSPKAGIMIREDFAMGSKNVFMGLTKGAASTFQRRTSANGGTTSTNGAVVTAPYWLKLTRQGSAFKGYLSPDGAAWTQVGTSVTVTMLANTYVGLAFTSKNNNVSNNVVFSNVSVRPATAPAAPVLNTATAGVGQVDLNWNASNRATSYKVKYGTVSGSYTTTLTLGNVTSTSVTGLNNGTAYYFVVTAVNDYGESVVSNQLSATPLDPPTVFIKKIDYNAMGQKTRIEYGNGVITTNTYDPLNLRLKRIYSVNASGQALQDLSYTYDSAGNILSIADALNTASQTFQYDALNRLTQASGTSYGTKTYQYDPIGNIVQKDGNIYGYAAGGAGIHAVTSLSDGTTMTYDLNGNMATKQKGTEITYFTYDVENRLIQIQKDLTSVPKASAKVTAQYAYDGDGGRVKKTVGSTVTRYVGSLFEETNGVRTRHIYVGDLKVASITGAQYMYYHTDHLGGTNVVTDKVGVKKEVIEYEPYGQFSRRDRYGTGAEVANFYFTGQKFDEESGLYYYNARFYDPALGRFISADTIVQSPSDGQTFNRYAYAGNNPVNNIDPSGHSFWKSFLAAFVGAVAAVVTAGISIGFSALAAAFTAGGGGFAAIGAGTLALSGAVGGAVSGGLGAALNGAGWQGVLKGAAIGGVLGGLGGFAGGGGFGAASGWVVGGMFAAGVANAAVNNSWADFTGGIIGGITGTAVGMSAVNAKFGTLSDSATASGGNIKRNVSDTVNNAKQGKIASSDIIQSVNNSKNNIGEFVSKVEAYVHLNGKEVDSILANEISRFAKLGGVSSGGKNWGLIGQGAIEVVGGVALQVVSIGLIGESAGASAPMLAGGISYSVGLIAKGFADISQGYSGGPSFGELLHTAVYGVKNESGILYPYIKAVTGDVPGLP